MILVYYIITSTYPWNLLLGHYKLRILELLTSSQEYYKSSGHLLQGKSKDLERISGRVSYCLRVQACMTPVSTYLFEIVNIS